MKDIEVKVEHPSVTQYDEEDELDHEEVRKENTHVLQLQLQESLDTTRPKRNYKPVQKFGSSHAIQDIRLD